jgi:hypothetical protein
MQVTRSNLISRTLCVSLVLFLSFLIGACKGENVDAVEEVSSTPQAEPQALTFSEGMTSLSQQGITGGNIDTENLGDGCFGLVGDSPGHRLTLDSQLNLNVQIVALNSALEDNNGDGLSDPDPLLDTTLVITGPGGPYCNDDANGLNPSLNLILEAGQYDLFVGTFTEEEEPVNYTLTVTESETDELTVTPNEYLPPSINSGRPPVPVPSNVGSRPNIPIPRPLTITTPQRDRGQPNIPLASPPGTGRETTTE